MATIPEDKFACSNCHGIFSREEEDDDGEENNDYNGFVTCTICDSDEETPYCGNCALYFDDHEFGICPNCLDA